jgi:hypothetical protein|uniref:Uncharacterized protein n=1 Tax=Siphoviridae sp. ctaDn21 TaxID=2825563 RepID=A0A8S5UUX4_9CAUD|nr:MAG TPA: hypothetical protein [Siphoviridae sp. ctaDn21]
MLGTIKDQKDITLLANQREYLLTDKGQGSIGTDGTLLPVVCLNGKAFQFSREELINYAYEQLTKE